MPMIDDLDEWVSDDEECAVAEDLEDCPTIVLSKTEKLRIRRPWKQSLIVKLLGRSIG